MDDRAAGLYDFSMFWTRTAPSSPWLKDEHVQLSEMGFRRFWARRESCVVQKAPILVGSTGPVFAQYWSARLAVGCSKARTASARARTASEGAPSETCGVHVRVHAIPGENRKNTQRTWRTHVTTASQEGDFVRTSHGPQPPMAPQVLRAGAHP